MPALATEAAVAVIGAGTMGAGIAQVAATHGHPVLLYDADPAAVDRGLDGIGKILARSVEKGRLDAGERDAVLGRITPCKALADLEGAALVVEAIVERLEIKQSVFAELEGIVGANAILASNTSSLSITAIGAALERPGRLVGMHFFNPAPLMRLVEVVVGLATDDAVRDTVVATAGAWGKRPVVAKSTPGFIANRIARPFYSETLRLREEQAADVATLDAILRDCGGFRMGPFQLMDLIGTDVNLSVTRSVWQAFHHDPRYAPSLLQEELVAGGRFGRKSGHGWYDYGAEARGTDASAADALQGPRPKRITLSQNPDFAPAWGPASSDPVAVLARLAREAGIEVAFEELFADFEELDDLPELPEWEEELTETGEPELDGTAEAHYSPFTETLIQLDGATLRLTRGLPAWEEDWGDPDENPVVHYDLCLDYAASPRIVIAAQQGAPRTATLAAAGFFQALGKTVTLVEDVPGLVLMRVVAMLANEAAEAVYTGVCDAEGADTAMLMGLNYPKGPLAWAREIGFDRVVDVLDNLHRLYGDPRYRVSPLLRRLKAEQSRDFAVT